MKRTEPKHIASIIAEAIDATGNRDSFDRQRLCYLWPEVVGATVNAHTTHRYIDTHRVMHVYIDSAALKNDLCMMRTILCRRLNGAIGKDVIDRIEFH